MAFRWNLLACLIFGIHNLNACDTIAEGTCSFQCGAHSWDTCAGQTLECAAGYSCTITCNGNQACKAAHCEVNANGAIDVQINCEGHVPFVSYECQDAQFECGTRYCNLNCGSHNNCDGAVIDTKDSASYQCNGDCANVAVIYPTPSPSNAPTQAQSNTPTQHPTKIPTMIPTVSPTESPLMSLVTREPTLYPITENPTYQSATKSPTENPSILLNISPQTTSSSAEFDEQMSATFGNQNEELGLEWFLWVILILGISFVVCLGAIFYMRHKKMKTLNLNGKKHAKRRKGDCTS